MPIKLIKIKAKSIFTKSKLGVDYSLNQYVSCGHNCSYCLEGKTLILMADGTTKFLKDLKVGDKIYGVRKDENTGYHYYEITEILAHWKSRQPAIKIVIEGGIEIICSPDHRWFSTRGWKYTIGRMAGLLRRPYLTDNNSIHGIGKLQAVMKDSNLYKRGYLSGVIRGDGLLKSYDYSNRRRAKDIQYQFRIAMKDKEAVIRTYDYLNDFGVKTNWFKFRLSEGVQADAIRINTKKGFQKIHRLIEYNSGPEYLRGFVAGIFDAEGASEKKSATLRIFNTDKSLLEFTRKSLRDFGFRVVNDKSNGNCKVIRIRGGLEEYVRFFQTFNPAIRRKRKIVLEGKQVKKSFKVKEIINFHEIREMYDITTGGKTFIANGVISHNCYAKFIQRWRPENYGKWGSWVEAKMNAPDLVKGRYVKGAVFMSSISDPYQPVEKDLKLTRRVLENLDKRTNLIIQTKSDLVLRDIDIFKKFKNIEIGFTINSFEGKTKKLFEPSSPENQKRIEALKILKQEGMRTYVFVSPIIPGLIDLKSIISTTKNFADYYWFEFINLRGAGKEFCDILKTKFPESYEILTDKNKFQKFIEDCKKIISSEGIKVQGIVIHNK